MLFIEAHPRCDGPAYADPDAHAVADDFAPRLILDAVPLSMPMPMSVIFKAHTEAGAFAYAAVYVRADAMFSPRLILGDIAYANPYAAAVVADL